MEGWGGRSSRWLPSDAIAQRARLTIGRAPDFRKRPIRWPFDRLTPIATWQIINCISYMAQFDAPIIHYQVAPMDKHVNYSPFIRHARPTN